MYMKNKHKLLMVSLIIIFTITFCDNNYMVKRKRPDTNPIVIQGFSNIGNTCYMNSTLQCLIRLNGFPRKLSYEINSKTKLTNSFLNIYKNLLTNNHKTRDIQVFKDIFSKKYIEFKGNRQHDSHEFMNYLLESIHDEINISNCSKYKVYPNGNGDLKKDKDISIKVLKLMTERDNSVIVDNFYGLFRHKISCMECKKTVTNFEKFKSISINITKNSIQECISDFEIEEVLDGQNKWNCPCCKKKVMAKKSINIWKLPLFLIIHLQRFKNNSKNNKTIKGDDIISLQNKFTSNLDLFEKKSAIYHMGSFNFGHYLSVVSENGSLHRYNDSQVDKINNFPDENAYIYIYTKK